MKISIGEDEFYPVYFEHEGAFSREVELTEEEYVRFVHAWNEWRETQEMIDRKMYGSDDT